LKVFRSFYCLWLFRSQIGFSWVRTIAMEEEGYKVLLNVYDLSQGLARQLSTSFLGRAIEGIWHTGIVVYGNEYYYGGGIQHTSVGKTPYGKPVKIVELGITHLPKEVFEEYLQEISPRYTAETYSLLHHNCNNFSNELAQFLVDCSIPEFILRLPEEVMNTPMGALLLPMTQQLETTLRYGGVPQAPHLGSSSVTPVVVEQRETSKLSSNRGKEESTVQEDANIGNGKPSLVTTTDRSSIPPAVGPVKLPSSDASLNVGTKEIDRCQKFPPKIELSERKQDEAIQEDPLKDAREKIQEEITREFATLMTSGSLRASEAAALAARRVMERHGRLNVTTRQS